MAGGVAVIIYLAARYTRRLELCGYRTDLEARGHRVPARWLLGAHQIDDKGLMLGSAGEQAVEDPDGVTLDLAETIKLRERFALDDFEDVCAAELLIAFTELPRAGASRGGRHVELGIALGRAKPTVIIGPRENIFTCLPWVQVWPDWTTFLARLDAGTLWPGADPLNRAGQILAQIHEERER
jgi:hypothetical protein